MQYARAVLADGTNPERDNRIKCFERHEQLLHWLFGHDSECTRKSITQNALSRAFIFDFFINHFLSPLFSLKRCRLGNALKFTGKGVKLWDIGR